MSKKSLAAQVKIDISNRVYEDIECGIPNGALSSLDVYVHLDEELYMGVSRPMVAVCLAIESCIHDEKQEHS